MQLLIVFTFFAIFLWIVFFSFCLVFNSSVDSFFFHYFFVSLSRTWHKPFLAITPILNSLPIWPALSPLLQWHLTSVTLCRNCSILLSLLSVKTHDSRASRKTVANFWIFWTNWKRKMKNFGIISIHYLAAFCGLVSVMWQRLCSDHEIRVQVPTTSTCLGWDFLIISARRDDSSSQSR